MVSILATLVVLAQTAGMAGPIPNNGFDGVLPIWVAIIVGGGGAFAATAAFGAPSRRRLK